LTLSTKFILASFTNLVTPQRNTWQNVNPHRAGGDGSLKGIENSVCTCSTYTWRITAAKRRSLRPLLPQIATMRMTVLNFSFARKLQSKLSLPTSYRRCALGFFTLKPSGSLHSSASWLAWHFCRLGFSDVSSPTDDSSRVATSLPQLRPPLSLTGNERCSRRKRDLRPLKCWYYIQDEFWTTTKPRWIVKNDRRRS